MKSIRFQYSHIANSSETGHRRRPGVGLGDESVLPAEGSLVKFCVFDIGFESNYEGIVHSSVSNQIKLDSQIKSNSELKLKTDKT